MQGSAECWRNCFRRTTTCPIAVRWEKTCSIWFGIERGACWPAVSLELPPGSVRHGIGSSAGMGRHVGPDCRCSAARPAFSSRPGSRSSTWPVICWLVGVVA